MKRLLLCLLLFPLAVSAQVPSYPARLDLQSPSRTFKLKWAAGSSPVLATYIYDGGRAFTNLSGWTGYVYVAVTPTAGVYVAASPAGSNRVDFSFSASQTATVGVFNVEVVLGNGTNTYRWGTGSLSLSNSPALLGAGTIPLTGIFNWDLFTFTGTQPSLTASYTNDLAGDVTGPPGATVIADDAVGTNKLSAEVRGLLAAESGISTNDPVWTGLVARVTATEATATTASTTGTAAHVLAASAFTLATTAANTGTAAHVLAAANQTTLAALLDGPASVGTYVGGAQTLYSITNVSDLNLGWHQYETSYSYESWLRYTLASDGIYGVSAVRITPGGSFTLGSVSRVARWRELWSINNDGAGSGLDADLLDGYTATDFALLSSLSNSWRITSGVVTSQTATGTRGEYRRSTTNAYFHDGSQWVTWSVSTNFSH